MKRKNIIIIILIITIIFTIKYFKDSLKEEDNLMTNSVYYAKNMPHAKDKHPVLIMLIDNLEYINKYNIDGIEYEIDGNNSIHNHKYNYNGINRYLSNSSLFKPISYTYNDNKGLYYIFDYNFKLVDGFDRHYKKIDISTVDEDALIDEIYEFVKPIVDSQTEPEVNLQEEFNERYKDRFN